MKQSINFNQFYDAFQAVRPDNFTYDGLKALYEYLEQSEEDTGQEIELDVIALCCEYSEYGSMVEFQEAYGDVLPEEHTTVIPVDAGGFIIQDY